jgi:excisionase family DNA binding protein
VPSEPSPRRRDLSTAVLEQDTRAFVEALEVPTDERLQARRRRDAAKARLELARLTATVDALADELQAAKRACDERDYSQLPMWRRLRSGRRPEALEEEVETFQRRLTRKHEEVQAKRIWTEALERDAEDSGPGHVAVIYRMHSANHHMSSSKGQYEHLLGVQRITPVSLTTRNGLRWWWHRDRFWWADAKLSADEVEWMILTRDLASEHQREKLEQARAGILGRKGAVSAEDAVPEEVRREVWMRDRGRCVDCDISWSVAFDHLLPLAVGGSNTAANLELRCRPCQQRRRANEAKATVGKARIGAHAAREWGVQLRDIGWPRAVAAHENGLSAAERADLVEELHRAASAKPETPDPMLLRPAEAADALGVNVSSVYRAVKNGELRAVRLAGEKRGGMRIPASEVQRLVDASTSRE